MGRQIIAHDGDKPDISSGSYGLLLALTLRRRVPNLDHTSRRNDRNADGLIGLSASASSDARSSHMRYTGLLPRRKTGV